MGFTNASNNTFPPTTLQPLYRIWRDWCIGDSLGYLNDNFLYLETLLSTLSSNLPVQTVNIAPSAVTAEKLSGGQTGSAPVYGCRAWVNFDATRNSTDTGSSVIGGNVKIRGSGNVSSVRKDAVGRFTIFFTTAMPHANYAVTGVTNETAIGNRSTGWAIYGTDSSSLNTSYVVIDTGSQATGNSADLTVNTVTIFG